MATSAAAAAGITFGAAPMSNLMAEETKKPLFKISVAEYSLHRLIRSGELDPRDYGPFCKQKFGVDAVEYWICLLYTSDAADE